MPRTEVYFWQDAQGRSPVLEALLALHSADEGAFTLCWRRIHDLGIQGHELRRPLADYLSEGIYELRVRKGRVQYRTLYFFHGKNVAILAHFFQKEGGPVPTPELRRALERKRALEADPETHLLRTGPTWEDPL